MTWSPLLSASAFTGIQTDMTTAVAGLMGLALIIVGVGVLYRVFAH